MLALLLPLVTLLVGCGAGPEATVAPSAAPTFAPVPTYTSTPQAPASAAAESTATATLVPVVLVQTILTPTVATASDVVTESQRISLTETILAATATVAPSTTVARLTVAGAAVNVRSGPDTAFDIVGSAVQGEHFDVLARSADSGWWQICCLNGQEGWIFGELATVENGDTVALAAAIPTPAQPTQPTPAPVVDTSTAAPADAPVAEAAPVEAPAAIPAVDPNASSAGDFSPDAQYQIVHFKVLGLGENNGGIRDSGAQHHIFLTVLDANGNGVDGAVVENLVGEKGTVTTGSKGPGKAEITMYYEPFKLRVATDPGGPVTSQTSNQMGLVFPHLPDLVGKLGDENYEYGACPTLEIRCEWPIQAIHFSYEITFQKVK
ncbi:MAG: SH3 domain-containing protein [Caldilineaceae bacterium]